MNAKFLLFIAITSIVIVAPVLAGYQSVPIGKYNLSLDFGGEIMEINTTETMFADDFAMDVTSIHEERTVSTNFGVIYLYDFGPSGTPVSTLSTMLENSVMADLCARTHIESYLNGYVQTGLFKIGGRKCWGVAMPLDEYTDQYKGQVGGQRSTKALMIFAFFKNETLNEHLVKTAKY